MWGPSVAMWGFWWIVPLIAFAMCAAFAVVMFRFMATGRGCRCMRSDGAPRADDTEALRREVRALRDEIHKVEAAR